MPLSKCRRVGKCAFTADEFNAGPGGKDYVYWSVDHGPCVHNSWQQMYFSLIEGSQFDDLAANVDKIAGQLEAMVNAVEQTVEQRFDEECAEVDRRILALGEAVEDQLTRRTEATDKLQDERIDALHATMLTLHQDVEALKFAQSSKGKDVEALDERLKAMESRISEIDTKVLSERVNSYEFATEVRGELEVLKRQVEKPESPFVEEDIQNLKAEIKKISSSMSFMKVDERMKDLETTTGLRADIEHVKRAVETKPDKSYVDREVEHVKQVVERLTDVKMVKPDVVQCLEARIQTLESGGGSSKGFECFKRELECKDEEFRSFRQALETKMDVASCRAAISDAVAGHLREAMGAKSDKDYVETEMSRLLHRLTEIQDLLDSVSLRGLDGRLQVLEKQGSAYTHNELETLRRSVASNDEELSSIRKQLNMKANGAELKAALASEVAERLREALKTKSDKAYVDAQLNGLRELFERLSDVKAIKVDVAASEAVDGAAAQLRHDLEVLRRAVDEKMDKSEVDSQLEKLADHLNKLAEVSDVSAAVDDRISALERGLREELYAKVEKTYVDDEIRIIRDSVDAKADFEEKLQRFGEALQDKADVDDVYSVRQALQEKLDRQHVDDALQEFRQACCSKADFDGEVRRLQEILATKAAADNVESLQEAVRAKAEKSYVDSVLDNLRDTSHPKGEVDGEFTSLREAMRAKVDIDEVQSLWDALRAKADGEDVQNLRDALHAKVDLDDLESLKGDLNAKAMEAKAEGARVEKELESLKEYVDRMTDVAAQRNADVAGASQEHDARIASELEAFREELGTKVSSQDFKAEIGEVDDQLQSLRQLFDSKADKDDVDAEVEGLRREVGPKADSVYVDGRIKTMSENINQKIDELHQGLLKATTQSVQLASLEMLKRVKELEKKVPDQVEESLEAPRSPLLSDRGRGSRPQSQPREMKSKHDMDPGRPRRQLRGVVSLPGLHSNEPPHLAPERPKAPKVELTPWK